jgi:EAL domain-containing protein (putative c-di-GMP-specific phosphodiesterase class I)
MGWAVVQAGGAGLPIGDATLNAELRAIGHPLLIRIADAGRRPASPCELEKLAEDPVKIAEGYRAAKLGAMKHEKIVAASQRWNEYNREINRWDGDPATEPSL